MPVKAIRDLALYPKQARCASQQQVSAARWRRFATMLLSSTSGQHVGEAAAYADTGVVRDAVVIAEPLPNETAPLVALL